MNDKGRRNPCSSSNAVENGPATGCAILLLSTLPFPIPPSYLFSSLNVSIHVWYPSQYYKQITRYPIKWRLLIPIAHAPPFLSAFIWLPILFFVWIWMRQIRHSLLFHTPLKSIAYSMLHQFWITEEPYLFAWKGHEKQVHIYQL